MVNFTPEQMAAEKRLRIRLAVAAYQYEILNVKPIMSDLDFDYLCTTVNLDCPTGSPEHDRWWRDNFDPATGMWVHNYPNKMGLARICGSLAQQE